MLLGHQSGSDRFIVKETLKEHPTEIGFLFQPDFVLSFLFLPPYTRKGGLFGDVVSPCAWGVKKGVHYITNPPILKRKQKKRFIKSISELWYHFTKSRNEVTYYIYISIPNFLLLLYGFFVFFCEILREKL